MMKQSPSRGPRGRGWKVKHVLQVCVLVAVCVWLAYQVKHSQDKKKALEESNLKVSERVEDGGANILKLGRKDPHGNVVIIDTDNSTQGEEEENKEDEGAAEHENKQEEIEEERKGTEGYETEGDGEEKTDEEAKHGEESGDEESNEEPASDAGVLESQDHEGADGGSQEAREEHYKADDASSAVVRDTQEMAQENEVLYTEENSEEQKEKALVEEIGKGGGSTNVTEDASKGTEEVHDSPVDGESQQDNNTLPVEAATVERESGAESLSNSTVAAESDDHIEAYRDTTSSFAEQMEQQNNSTGSDPNHLLEQQNSSMETARDEQMGAQSVSGGVDAETVVSTTPENATMLDMASSEDQSQAREVRTLEEGSSKSENNLTAVEHNEQTEQQSNSTENVSDEQMQNISEGVSTESVVSISGNATVDDSSVQDQNVETGAAAVAEGNTTNTENVPAEETEKSNLTGVEGGVGGSRQQTSSSTEENGDATVRGDGTSASGDHLPNATTEQEQDSPTDLSTLPEVETKSAGGIAAE